MAIEGFMSEQAGKMAEFEVCIDQETLDMMEKAFSFCSNEEYIEIKTDADYDYVVEMVKKVKTYAKHGTVARGELTQPLEAAKKSLIAQFKAFETMTAATERRLKDLMGAYQAQEEESRRKAQAALDRKAEAKRKRLEARAKAATDDGNDQKAQDLLQKAAFLPVDQVAGAPEVAGVSQSSRYVAELEDLSLFVAGVASGKIGLKFIDVNQPELNKAATAMGLDLNFPGVSVRKKNHIVIRN
jgi:hypothetical protein